MKAYTVTIPCHGYFYVEVQAPNEEKALELAQDKIDNDPKLQPDDLELDCEDADTEEQSE